MEIVDFKNFSQFQAFMRQEKDKMPHWSTEKTQWFCERVNDLCENNPEFKEEYDKWIKKARISAAKKKGQIVTLDGTSEEKAQSLAYLKLRKIAKKKSESSKDVGIEIIKARKMRREI